jgi:hypothetical protein
MEVEPSRAHTLCLHPDWPRLHRFQCAPNAAVAHHEHSAAIHRPRPLTVLPCLALPCSGVDGWASRPPPLRPSGRLSRHGTLPPKARRRTSHQPRHHARSSCGRPSARGRKSACLGASPHLASPSVGSARLGGNAVCATYAASAGRMVRCVFDVVASLSCGM